jgi:hypothetical protein
MARQAPERAGGTHAVIEPEAERPTGPDVEPKADDTFSTAEALLRHAGTWVGDDLEELLEEVYSLRGEAEF